MLPSCTINGMRIIVEDEAAVERVRRRGGDKSATETVARLIAEADVAGDEDAPRGNDLVQRNGNGDVIARMNRKTGETRRVVPAKRARKGTK